MSPLFALLADVLVAVLLVATIASSVALSRRITRLKEDESAMRSTVTELMVATETAERAIAGLRTTLSECDRTLAERLRVAERYAADLAAQVQAGETVMERIARIVETSRQLATLGERRPPAPAVEAAPDRLAAAVAAAQAIAERTARRAGVSGP